MGDTTHPQPDGSNGPAPSPREPEIAQGVVLDRYVVLKRLGSGAMGVVYLAIDGELERRVAIKVLASRARSGEPSAETRLRLLHEAQALAKVSHPNVISVYDVGTFGREVFIAMEFARGQTLRDWLGQARSVGSILDAFTQAGRGLQAAHDAGVLHRDFKPENAVIGEKGDVKVLDFGLATLEPSLALNDSASIGKISLAETGVHSAAGLGLSLTHGAIIGTPAYMAPELLVGQPATVRSDQFAFAVALYEALYGERPFEGDSLPALEASSRAGRMRASPKGARVPAYLRGVLARATSAAPEKRFGSMGDMLRALRIDPAKRRHRWVSASVALVVVSVAGLVGTAARQRSISAQCAAGDALIAQAWNFRTREDVSAAIRASGAVMGSDLADRTTTVLDDWSKAWATAYRDATEATLVYGTETASTMNARTACLDHQRERLTAFIDRLVHSDKPTALHALSATYGLPAPKRCWDPDAARAATLPIGAGPRARALSLRKELARLSAVTITGSCDGVIEAANHGIEEARAAPQALSEAYFLVLRAGCEWDSGDVAAANTSRRSAFAAALAADDDALAARMAAAIAFGYARSSIKSHEARDWLEIAKGAARREGHTDITESAILEAEVEILSAGGFPEKAIPLYEHLIALDTRLYGPSHPGLAGDYNNYAADLNHLGRTEDGIAALRKAIAIHEEVYGPDAPVLYLQYNNLGFAYTQLGRYEEAREAIARSLALVASFGPKSANAILPLASMAVVDNRSGRPGAATNDVEQAMAIVRETGDNGAIYLPCLFEQRGRALLKQHDTAGAVAACGQGVKLQEEQGVIGPDKVYSDDALTCLGEAELAAGDADAAIRDLERSLTLTKRDWKAEVPVAKIELAKALRLRGREPERARRLAAEGAAELNEVLEAEQRERGRGSAGSEEGRIAHEPEHEAKVPRDEIQ